MVQHTITGHQTSLYSVFKQANEETARIYWQDHRIVSIGLRPATVYGPGHDQPFHIPYGGRGEFQYADDVAKAFIACARTSFAGAKIFNLHGSARPAVVLSALPALVLLVLYFRGLFPRQ